MTQMKTFMALMTTVTLTFALTTWADDDQTPAPITAMEQASEVSQPDSNKIKKGTDEINEQILNLRKDIEKAQGKVEKLKNEIGNLNNNNNVREIKNLNDSLATLDSLISEKEAVIKCQKDTLKNGTHIANLNSQIDSINKQNSNLIAYADSTRKSLLDRAEKLNKSLYSAIDTAELDSVLELLKKYKDDPNLQTPAAKVRKTNEIKKTYDKAIEVLNSPYDKDKVKASIRSLEGIKSNVLANKDSGKKQWDEMSRIIEQLKDYGPVTEAFGNLHKTILDLRKDFNYNSSRLCADEVNEELQKFDTTYKDKISKLPFLNEKYKKYKELVEKNAFTGDKIAEEILNDKDKNKEKK